MESELRKLVQIFKIIFVGLALDTVLGVISCAIFVAKIFQVKLPPGWIIFIPFSITAVYGLDRLIDVSDGNVPNTARHKFYKKYYYILLAYSCIVLISTTILLALYFPMFVLLLNICLGVLVLLHITALGKKPFSKYYGTIKDIMVAFIYTSFIWGNVYFLNNRDVKAELYYHFILFFFLTVLLNLWVYTFLDRKLDSIANKVTLGTKLAKQNLIGLIGLLFCLIIIHAAYLLITHSSQWTNRKCQPCNRCIWRLCRRRKLLCRFCYLPDFGDHQLFCNYQRCRSSC